MGDATGVRTVLLLAPMDVELEPLARHFSLRPRQRRGGDGDRVGTIGTAEVVLRRCGVGPQRAGEETAAALGRLRPDHVVVAGVAGGLGRGVRVGDLVVPAVVTSFGDPATHRATALGSLEPSGRLVSCARLMAWDDLAGHAAEGATAVDMESAGVAAAAEEAGVPWTAIRGISDLVGDDVVTADTIDLVREDGTTDGPAVARLLAGHPGRIRALAAMARGSGKAMSTVCAALAAGLGGEPTGV